MSHSLDSRLLPAILVSFLCFSVRPDTHRSDTAGYLGTMCTELWREGRQDALNDHWMDFWFEYECGALPGKLSTALLPVFIVSFHCFSSFVPVRHTSSFHRI